MRFSYDLKTINESAEFDYFCRDTTHNKIIFEFLSDDGVSRHDAAIANLSSIQKYHSGSNPTIISYLYALMRYTLISDEALSIGVPVIFGVEPHHLAYYHIFADFNSTSRPKITAGSKSRPVTDNQAFPDLLKTACAFYNCSFANDTIGANRDSMG